MAAAAALRAFQRRHVLSTDSTGVALIRADGATVFESNVILDYLEDKHRDDGPRFLPPTPEERQFVGLLNRVHDLYIASPNCTQPNFAHTQGCMYLGPKANAQVPAARTMARSARSDCGMSSSAPPHCTASSTMSAFHTSA